MTTPTPLLLVHGWAGSADIWDPVVAHLDTTRWAPSAIRLPGSPGAATVTATVAEAASTVAAALRSAPTPAMIVGHSMGAQITILVHGTNPDLVLGEVVIDPAYAADPSERAAHLRRAEQIDEIGHDALSEFFDSALSRKAPEALRDSVNRDVLNTPASLIASYLRSEYLDHDAIGLMPATIPAAARRRAPVLSLHSSAASAGREGSLPTTPRSRSVIWDESSHFLHLEDPAAFVALLDEWREHLLAAS